MLTPDRPGTEGAGAVLAVPSTGFFFDPPDHFLDPGPVDLGCQVGPARQGSQLDRLSVFEVLEASGLAATASPGVAVGAPIDPNAFQVSAEARGNGAVNSRPISG